MNPPPHPADFLNEVLMPATGRSDGEVARLLGISLQVFYTILTREKPISPVTASMLGRLFNTGEEFWLKMQAEHDRFMAAQRVVDCEPTVGNTAPVGETTPVRYLSKDSAINLRSGSDDPVSEFADRDVISWVPSI
jgi:addiction module HigA family antidote